MATPLEMAARLIVLLSEIQQSENKMVQTGQKYRLGVMTPEEIQTLERENRGRLVERDQIVSVRTQQRGEFQELTRKLASHAHDLGVDWEPVMQFSIDWKLPDNLNGAKLSAAMLEARLSAPLPSQSNLASPAASQIAADRQRWANQIRSTPSPNIAILKSVAEGLLKFGEQAWLKEITPDDAAKLLMDLVCDAIVAGAFAGIEWRNFRTRLANDPSFENALAFSNTYAPINWPTRGYGPTISNRTWVFSLNIGDFIRLIESSIATAVQPIIQPPVSPEISLLPASTEPVPPDNHEEILQALFLLKAFDRKSRQSASNIAEKIETGLDPTKLKEPMSALARQALIRTKTGRGGGAWLTETGKKTGEEIDKR